MLLLMKHSTMKKKASATEKKVDQTGSRPSSTLHPLSPPFLLITSIGITVKPLISFNRLLFFSLPTGEFPSKRNRERRSNGDEGMTWM